MSEKIYAGQGTCSPIKQSFLRMAHYNRRMNGRLLDVVSDMPDSDYRRDLGAFFNSIHGTLNHILVWDITWLQRIADHHRRFASLDIVRGMERPVADDQVIFEHLEPLRHARSSMDETLAAFVDETGQDDYTTAVTYRTSDGTLHQKCFAGLLQHVFNHQTHHRGQITTLLSQLGVEFGVTDLLAVIPEFGLAEPD